MAGYGPLNTRSFKNIAANKPHLNADSYRVFAQELYWTIKCSPTKKYYNAPTINDDFCKEKSSTCMIM